jgi:exonuclease-1
MAGFRNANAGFLYQHVFDPRIRMYTRMSDLPECVDFDLNVLGESPVDKDIPLLRSNGAIIVTKEDEQVIVVKEKEKKDTVKVKT